MQTGRKGEGVEIQSRLGRFDSTHVHQSSMHNKNERSGRMDKELRKKLRTIEALEAARELVDRYPYSRIYEPLMKANKDAWVRLEEALDELEQCK